MVFKPALNDSIPSLPPLRVVFPSCLQRQRHMTQPPTDRLTHTSVKAGARSRCLFIFPHELQTALSTLWFHTPSISCNIKKNPIFTRPPCGRPLAHIGYINSGVTVDSVVWSPDPVCLCVYSRPPTAVTSSGYCISTVRPPAAQLLLQHHPFARTHRSSSHPRICSACLLPSNALLLAADFLCGDLL